VLLVADGITIAWKDVRERVEALDALAPEFSRKKKIQKVLSDYTIPILFARRDFAEQRNAQRDLATTLNAAPLDSRILARLDPLGVASADIDRPEDLTAAR
jgi:hypothetical protein